MPVLALSRSAIQWASRPAWTWVRCSALRSSCRAWSGAGWTARCCAPRLRLAETRRHARPAPAVISLPHVFGRRDPDGGEPMSESPNYETILYERQNRIALITLNRPEKLNAWSAQLEGEFINAIETATADPETHAIVLTSSPPPLSP